MPIDPLPCSERRFGDFLIANPILDNHPELQAPLRRIYWQARAGGHTAAIQACIQACMHAGITTRLYASVTDIPPSQRHGRYRKPVR